MTSDEVKAVIAGELRGDYWGQSTVEADADSVLAALAAKGLVIGTPATGSTGERSLDIARQEFESMGLALVRVVT